MMGASVMKELNKPQILKSLRNIFCNIESIADCFTKEKIWCYIDYLCNRLQQTPSIFIGLQKKPIWNKLKAITQRQKLFKQNISPTFLCVLPAFQTLFCKYCVILKLMSWLMKWINFFHAIWIALITLRAFSINKGLCG